MDGAMKNDGGFIAATAAAENMQARYGIAITRGSRRDALNIAGVLRGNVLHPLKMVIVWMVRCEPGGISRAGYHSHEGVKALHSDIAIMVWTGTSRHSPAYAWMVPSLAMESPRSSCIISKLRPFIAFSKAANWPGAT